MDPKVCSGVIVVSALISASILFLMYGAYVWLDRLHKQKECVCANDWRASYIRKFLQVMIVYMVIHNAFVIWRLFTTNCAPYDVHPVVRVFYVLLQIAMFIYVVFALQYISKLRKSNCSCAIEGKGDNYLQVHATLMAVLYATVATLVVASVILVPVILISNKTKKIRR